MTLLCSYDLPGNVRELQNILERAFVLCHDEAIGVEHLPSEVSAARSMGRLKPSERKIAAQRGPRPRDHALSSEAEQLVAVLEAHQWNRTATARALGIGRNTLWRRMKEYGLS
jgi:transcriptional regulator of acetoin/glycerol metabolism